MQASRIASRVAAATAVAGTAVLALSVPAFAHVTVQPEGTAAKGGYAVVDFKVPNERDKSTTTKVEVAFPDDHPLASVMPEPVPGWNVQVTKAKLSKPLTMHGEKIDEAVTKVTWTAADGKGIQPGYFQKFPLSVGALPENTDQLVFKALQTYSDNEVVRWIEVPQAGQNEPENPAPVLQLSTATDGHHGTADAKGTADKTENAAAATDSGSHDTDTTARVLGVVGIVVGVAGVAYGVLAGRRRTA
ncbi:YcnI family protein [Streptomyces roseochromogenus]|uniref:Membrane protein n=1 Tax=Streptomyces roseochromogenus subsp. oscitans DS 12.976 TaxID=1352936 RepID=V6KI79_STRRC|nr:YcnI family protein [Streptomyces roseochromogenus]EST28664.1 membrane protein [Streptomyces roseochromogenus subsp. oscitans DS 12.976]